MADKKSKEKDADEKGGGSKRMITALVLSVAMLGAGYFVGGMMSGGAAEPAPADAAAAEEEVVEEPSELGYLVGLDAINVNLADGAYLRIAVSIELDKDLVEKDSKTGEISFATAPAADMVLATFSGRALDALSTAAGRDAARTTLFDRVYEVYGSQVKGLYFTEFVMQ